MLQTEPIAIENVYPWGRSFDEYLRMFALSPSDLNLRILACADGPASFNAEMARRGKRVISCDPLYKFSSEDIRSRITATHDLMVEKAARNCDRFVWNEIESPEKLGLLRMAAMNDFLNDFQRGRDQGRYLPRSLPKLHCDQMHFDLALCSHFLFLYSDDFSLDFHFDSVLQMLRLAKEVRIFPLLDMRGEESAHLHPLLDRLSCSAVHADIIKVRYEFQRGGDEMLRVRTNR